MRSKLVQSDQLSKIKYFSALAVAAFVTMLNVEVIAAVFLFASKVNL